MGKRGPSPKPTEKKVIAGNPGKQELNHDEPKFAAPVHLAPPEFLDEIAISEWNKIAPNLTMNGLLTTVDLAAFAAYCVAYSRWVQAEQAVSRVKHLNATLNGLAVKGTRGTLVANPLVRIASDAMDQMLKAAGQFGMTPSARSNIKVEKQSDANPFNSLAKPTVQ